MVERHDTIDAPSRLLWLVPTAMLVIALAPLPYGYYTLLRLVVCVCAGVIAYQNYVQTGGKITSWFVGLVGLALLFNPIFPVHLTRGIWAPINLASAVFLLAHMWFERDRKWSRRT